MAMKFEEIMTTYYANEFKLGQFTLAYDASNTAYIASWDVPNVPQPTVDEVYALDTPTLEKQFQMTQFLSGFLLVLAVYVDSVAKQKNYDNAISCISYLNSTAPQWQAEAHTFSLWRDSVWSYLVEQQQLILSGQRPIPASFQELIDELPVIVWPN